MSIELKVVENKADLKRFIQFPLGLYKNSPYWVPSLALDDLGTLNLAKNPAGEFCESCYWLAYRDGRAVGRIAAIVNNAYIKKWGKKLGRFGWFDVADDFEAAQALLSAAEAWVKGKGLEGIHGPLGFTDLDREGMLIEGFDQRGTMATNYNHAYYPAFLERLGYAKDVDWIEFIVQVPKVIPEKVLRVNELIAKRTGVSLFSWKKSKELVKFYGDEIFELLDVAYAGLYGTTPFTRRQVNFYIKQYLGFVDPRFTKVIIDENKKLIGFGLALPSLSDALIKSKGRLLPLGWYRLLKALKNPEVIDLSLVAVRPEYQSRGVIAILMTDLNRSAILAGVRLAESNPELETNLAVQQLWKDYERRQHKRRRVFIKAI